MMLPSLPLPIPALAFPTFPSGPRPTLRCPSCMDNVSTVLHCLQLQTVNRILHLAVFGSMRATWGCDPCKLRENSTAALLLCGI